MSHSFLLNTNIKNRIIILQNSADPVNLILGSFGSLSTSQAHKISKRVIVTMARSDPELLLRSQHIGEPLCTVLFPFMFPYLQAHHLIRSRVGLHQKSIWNSFAALMCKFSYG